MLVFLESFVLAVNYSLSSCGYGLLFCGLEAIFAISSGLFDLACESSCKRVGKILPVPLGRVWKNSGGACSTVVPIVYAFIVIQLRTSMRGKVADTSLKIHEQKQKNTGELKKENSLVIREHERPCDD